MRLFFVMFVAVLAPAFASAEPWYYQDDRDSEFNVPDKVQHYLGSWLLSEATSPVLAFSAGILWELKQKAQGGEFDEKDLLLDLLGSWKVGYINFNRRDERWTVNISVGL